MSAALQKPDAPSRSVTLRRVVISFPTLFVPKQVLGQGAEYYGATFLMDPSTNARDIEAMKAAIRAACDQGWPNGEWRARATAGEFHNPLRDGNAKMERKGYAGRMFVSARTKDRPGVVDQNVQMVTDPNRIYPGLLVNVSLVTFPYKQPKWGVGVALNNVQIVADGERLGGRPDPSAEFEPVDYDAGPTDNSWLT